MTDPKLANQPSSSDPAEQRIRTVLEQELLSTSWARGAIDKSKKLLTKFLVDSIHKLGGEHNGYASFRQSYEEVLDSLNETLNASVKGGREHIDNLKGSPVIIVTNHLGTPKLSRFTNEEVVPDLEIEPFPIRCCAFKQISDTLEAPLHETAVELPGKLSELQKASGVVTIPVSGEGRTQSLVNSVEQTIRAEPNAVFVMYPEGGTTGKRNSKGPYDLEGFHKGSFAVAAVLGLPVLPVCQFFNPTGGLETYILPPITSSQLTTLGVDKATENTQHMMQEKLDALKSHK